MNDVSSVSRFVPIDQSTSGLSSNITDEIDSVDFAREANVLDEVKLENLLREYK